MRSLARLSLLAAVSLATIGCDGGGGMEEGVPKNVDMSKTYKPDAALPGADMFGKAAAKARPKVAPDAPVDGAPDTSK